LKRSLQNKDDDAYTQFLKREIESVEIQICLAEEQNTITNLQTKATLEI